MSITLKAVSVTNNMMQQNTSTYDRPWLYAIAVCVVFAIVRIVFEWIAGSFLRFEGQLFDWSCRASRQKQSCR